MANKSIKDAFQRMWQHCISSFATKEYVDNAVENDGPPSWNDLTDKPFGETLVDKKVFVDRLMGPSSSSQILRETTSYHVQENDIFVVTVGDVQYKAIATNVDGLLTLVWEGETYDYLSAKPFYGDSDTPVYYILHGRTPLLEVKTNVKYALVEYSVDTLDEKFIPDTIARKSDIQTAIGDAIGGSY